jgi:hypothetical protein
MSLQCQNSCSSPAETPLSAYPGIYICKESKTARVSSPQTVGKPNFERGIVWDTGYLFFHGPRPCRVYNLGPLSTLDKMMLERKHHQCAPARKSPICFWSSVRNALSVPSQSPMWIKHNECTPKSHVPPLVTVP